MCPINVHGQAWNPATAETRARESGAAETKRTAIAGAHKIVAIWNARQAGGRALWFYPTIGAAIAAGVPWLHLLVPGVRPVRLARPSHARSASGRGSL